MFGWQRVAAARPGARPSIAGPPRAGGSRARGRHPERRCPPPARRQPARHRPARSARRGGVPGLRSEGARAPTCRKLLHAWNASWRARSRAIRRPRRRRCGPTATSISSATSRPSVFRSVPSCGGILKPAVVFFGENVPREWVKSAHDALRDADALLVVGSSLMVFSAYRLCLAARDQGKPIAAVNLGPHARGRSAQRSRSSPTAEPRCSKRRRGSGAERRRIGDGLLTRSPGNASGRSLY